MNSQIPIPSYPFSTQFKPFTMTISSSSISTSIPLYLHQCKNIEYQEMTTDPTQSSLSNPQTVYFYNEKNNKEVLQLEAQRKEVSSEPQPQEENTLYFINEEESEP